MKNVVISIQYAGLTLPVIKSPEGVDSTPLKPIVDLLGLRWQAQRKKLVDSPFYVRHLGLWLRPRGVEKEDSGIETLSENADSGIPRYTSNGDSGSDSPTSNPTYLDEVMIRIDRVNAYLLTTNPDQVRSQGNLTSAEYLEAKLAEWADALHDYEELGIALNMSHFRAQEAVRKQRTSFAQMIGVKNKTPELQDRQAISRVLKQMADELKIPYQPDLADGA